METISLDLGPLMWAVWIAAGALLVLVASAWLVIYRLGEILDELQATRASRDTSPAHPQHQ